MASWADFAAAEPALAERVRGRLDAGAHKTLATIRADGGPRISGNEAWIAGDDLWFGCMWRAARARDLRRDPRFALHTASPDPPGWAGDASLSGRVEEVVEPERAAVAVAPLDRAPDGPWHLFRADLDEVLMVALNDAGDRLVIEVWRPGEPVRRVLR
jgi:Pyridoxamine 5'-phosphate oxidase